MRLARIAAFFVLLIALASVAFFRLVPQSNRIAVAEASAKADEDHSNRLRIFLKLENKSGADRLIAVSSSVADRAEIYSPEAVGGIPIPSGATPVLAPDGVHIILNGVDGALEDGRLIPISLTFESAGEITTKARLGSTIGNGRAQEAGLFGLGDICVVGEGEPAPEVQLRSEQIGDTGSWRVHIDAKDFEFSEHLTGQLHIPGTGHGHIYVGGLKLQRVYASTIEIGALPPGDHVVRVTLNTNDHRAYVVDDVPVTAETTITVR